MSLSVEVDLSQLPILTLDQVAEVTRFERKDLAKEIKKSGIWRIVSGSRGYLDEIEYIGALKHSILCLPSLEEVIAEKIEDCDDEEELEYIADATEELYGIDQETHEEAVLFQDGWSDEEFAYFVKVKIQK